MGSFKKNSPEDDSIFTEAQSAGGAPDDASAVPSIHTDPSAVSKEDDDEASYPETVDEEKDVEEDYGLEESGVNATSSYDDALGVSREAAASKSKKKYLAIGMVSGLAVAGTAIGMMYGLDAMGVANNPLNRNAEMEAFPPTSEPPKDNGGAWDPAWDPECEEHRVLLARKDEGAPKLGTSGRRRLSDEPAAMFGRREHQEMQGRDLQEVASMSMAAIVIGGIRPPSPNGGSLYNMKEETPAEGGGSWMPPAAEEKPSMPSMGGSWAGSSAKAGKAGGMWSKDDGEWGGWGSAKAAKAASGGDWKPDTTKPSMPASGGWSDEKWGGWSSGGGSAKSAKAASGGSNWKPPMDDEKWGGWASGGAKSAKSAKAGSWKPTEPATKPGDWMPPSKPAWEKPATNPEWKPPSKPEWEKPSDGGGMPGWEKPAWGTWGSGKAGKGGKMSKSKCTKTGSKQGKAGGNWDDDWNDGGGMWPWPKPATDKPTLEPTPDPTPEPTLSPTQSDVPSVSLAPTVTIVPSISPSVSIAPSVSLLPSIAPSVSIVPTDTDTPSIAPSTSTAPSDTAKPTDPGGPGNQSCSIPEFGLTCTDPKFPYCCKRGSGKNASDRCRPTVESCQEGLASANTCTDADVGTCGGDTPECCKTRDGSRDVFQCVAEGTTEEQCLALGEKTKKPNPSPASLQESIAAPSGAAESGAASGGEGGWGGDEWNSKAAKTAKSGTRKV